MTAATACAIFGASSLYLVLKVGLTVSASPHAPAIIFAIARARRALSS